MIKKLLYILLSLALAAGLAVLLGFAASNNLQTPCHRFEIEVISRSGNHFIRAENIRQLATGKLDTLEGKVVGPELLGKLHGIVNNIPYVDKASVYRTINGELKAEATLRDPLLRIINSNNQSYYIDTQGTMFPLSDEYTARVMLATGRITTDYSPGFNVLPSKETKEASPGTETLYDLVRLATFIAGDDFWNAFIDHIVVLPNGKFELTPKNGVHIIEFGEATNIEKKFGKLRKFYANGLSRTGWYHYNRVNVEFNQQVICSR